MEKKIALNEEFYGAMLSSNSQATCGLVFSCPAIFGICTILDTCGVSDVCSNTPCSETCSDSPSVVTPWSWTASNGSASPAQTIAMYNAINGTRQLDGLSYLVWNDLCDKVNETAIASGDAWLTNWGTLSATKMSSGNKSLTAQRFNALKNNVGARESTGIQDVGVDSPIYWEYFLTIATKLNTWISSL